MSSPFLVEVYEPNLTAMCKVPPRGRELVLRLINLQEAVRGVSPKPSGRALEGCPNHTSNMQSMATPREIQWAVSMPGCDRGKYFTKFVEWPVVDSVPLRSEVL